MARKMVDMRCDGCGVIEIDRYVDVETLPAHDGCGGRWVALAVMPGQRRAVVTDDIPGGVEIRHGLCNDDGTPRRYYSKTEIRHEAARRGMAWHYDANIFAPIRGSDRAIDGTRKWV